VLRKFPPPPMAKKPGSAAPARPSGPPVKKPAGGAAPKSPVQPGRSGGLFGKKPQPEPQTPVVDTKALAPKPGAKPVNPKKGARPASKPKG